MPNELRHAILGAGGIGGLMGACLARSGAPPPGAATRRARVARVGSAGIEWKGDKQDSLLRAPRGIEHHYAPLGIINWTAGNVQAGILNCRTCRQVPAVTCGNAAVAPGGAVVLPHAANAAVPSKAKRPPKPPGLPPP